MKNLGKKTDPVPVGTPLDLTELTTVLVKHYGLHEGLYDLWFQWRLGAGMFGPTQEQAIPGAAVGLAQISLSKVEKAGFFTVDAARVNPAPRKAKNKTKSSK